MGGSREKLEDVRCKMYMHVPPSTKRLVWRTGRTWSVRGAAPGFPSEGPQGRPHGPERARNRRTTWALFGRQLIARILGYPSRSKIFHPGLRAVGSPKIPLAVPIYQLPNEVRGMYLNYGPRNLRRCSPLGPRSRARSRDRFMDSCQTVSLDPRGGTRLR